MPLSRSSLSFMSSNVARTCCNRSSITTLQMLHRSCDFPFSVFFFTGYCFLLLEARDYSFCSLIAVGRIETMHRNFSLAQSLPRAGAHSKKFTRFFLRTGMHHTTRPDAGKTRVSGPTAHRPPQEGGRGSRAGALMD